MGSKLAYATPRWSPLGVKFKISKEHPRLFHIGVPPGDYMHLVLAVEFLRRLNMWLNDQSENGYLAQSIQEVDQAMVNKKFPHDFTEN